MADTFTELLDAYAIGLLTGKDAIRVLREVRPDWFPTEAEASEGSSLNAGRQALYSTFAEVTRRHDPDVYLAHGQIETLKRRGIKVEWEGRA